MAGITKLAGDPAMVDMFTTLGSPTGLRLTVGALELLGAVALLIPLLAALSAAAVAALMIGAAIANVAVLDSSPVLPLVFLLVAAVIVALRRHDLAVLAGKVRR